MARSTSQVSEKEHRAWSWKEVVGLAKDAAKKELVCAFVALVVSSGTNLAFPRILGFVVDLVAKEPEKRSISLTKTAALSVGVFVFGSLGSLARVYFLTLAEAKIVRKLRGDIFRAAMLHGDSSRQDASAIVSCLTSDSEELAKSICKNASSCYRGMNSAFGGSIMLFSISPKLTFMSMGLLPIVGAGAMRFSKFSKRQALTYKGKSSEAIRSAGERLRFVNTVRLFNNDIYEVDRFESDLLALERDARRAGFAEGIFMGGLSFALNSSLLAIVLYGGKLVSDKSISTGQLASFALYSGFMGLGFSQLSSSVGNFSRALGASERLQDFLLEETDGVNLRQETSVEVHQLRANPSGISITFDDLSFSYPSNPSEPVLQNFSLKIHPGQVILVAGRSGSGKTTLARLVARIENAWGGSICMNGLDISRIPLKPYRELLSVMDQRPALFSKMSIADNIRYSRFEASLDDVKRAAARAKADSFIEKLPEGYDTILEGDDTVALSVGQLQRIALARAFLRDARVFVFDEHSSSLDHQSEQFVQRSIRALAEANKTVMVIAHRSSLFQVADRIIFLENGVVADEGTLEELKAKPEGAYFKFLRAIEEEREF